MDKFGRIIFVILTFPAILYCDGWKLTLTGARAFIRGDRLKTHNNPIQLKKKRKMNEHLHVMER